MAVVSSFSFVVAGDLLLLFFLIHTVERMAEEGKMYWGAMGWRVGRRYKPQSWCALIGLP